MPKFQITLSTVASITVTVNADDEDDALEAAYEAARQFSDEYHAGPNWSVAVNEAWQYEEPEVKRIEA